MERQKYPKILKIFDYKAFFYDFGDQIVNFSKYLMTDGWKKTRKQLMDQNQKT